ncbi:MAG: type II secretion system protein N [Pseudomonadota bacterium]
MTRRARIALIVMAALAMLVIQLPLSATLPLVIPRDSGLSARSATGTIWSGTLHDAQLAGLPLGDTRVGLLPLALLTGQARLQFVSARLRGTLVATATSFGIAHGTGPIEAAVRVKPLPIAQLVLDDATVLFGGKQCAEATGNVRAVVGGDIGGITLPGGMSGTLRCDGHLLLVPLVGQSGMERLDIRIDSDGKWRGELIVRAADQGTVAKLAAAGFLPGPSGYIIRLTGAL